MLRLVNSVSPDLDSSVRGVFFQGAFPDRVTLVAYDRFGVLRRRVEVGNGDVEADEEAQMWAWLDRHDPV